MGSVGLQCARVRQRSGTLSTAIRQPQSRDGLTSVRFRAVTAKPLAPSLPTSPPATRRTRPSWLEPRLGIGIALVLVSVFVGARVIANADNSIQVWSVTGDMSAGKVLRADDIEPTRVRLYDTTDRYLRTGRDIVGKTLTKDIAGGELIGKDAVRRRACGAVIALSIPASHVPASIRDGARINVYASGKSSGDSNTENPDGTNRILHAVVVQEAAKPKTGLLTSNAQWAITVRVRAASEETVVSSLRDSELDVAVVDEPGADTDPCNTEEVDSSSDEPDQVDE